MPRVPPLLQVRHGELWAVNFEPQSHREEPGKFGKPALVMQSDPLNAAHDPSTIVIPGTSQTQPARHRPTRDHAAAVAADDLFPLRVRRPVRKPVCATQRTCWSTQRVRYRTGG